jgi:hypothetical protein
MRSWMAERFSAMLIATIHCIVRGLPFGSGQSVRDAVIVAIGKVDQAVAVIDPDVEH